uniref:Uncharacterized protein n=1 Tax=Ditylenchus dipsaci TaxID=166011 RepID=A0A915DZD6_9BILA
MSLGQQQRPNVKTPETFLGENSSLVNLDNLMGPTSNSVSSAKTTAAAANPFMLGSSNIATNPFAAQQRPSPSLHEMMTAQRSASVNNDSNGTQHPVNLPVHPQIPLLCRYFKYSNCQ